MKKIPITLLVVAVVVAFGAYFLIQSGIFSSADTVDVQFTAQTSTTTSSGTVGPSYFACNDKTRIRMTYGENSNQAELAFHDELFVLQRAESDSGARYTNIKRGIEYLEQNGEVTVKQSDPELTITCTPTTE